MRLHDYQQIAVQHLRQHPHAGLFLDMGLGKTACVLSALTPEHLPALVVAPKRVAHEVWPSEAHLWRPDLSLIVAEGPPAARERALRAGRDITVIGRDNLPDLLHHTTEYRTIVLDELSGFKTRDTIRWKTMRRVAGWPKAPVPYVWGLTGTPSPNGLMDLWAQLYLLDGGERLGTTLTGFRNRYFIPGRQLPNGVIIEWLLRPEAEAAIHRKIDDICLSMQTDGRIVLPPITYNQVTVELPPAARQTYRILKRDMVANMQLLGVGTGEGIYTAGSAAVLTNRLSQLAAGFLYPDQVDTDGTTQEIHRAKLAAVQEIVDGTGSPVLVFYRYTWERDALLAMEGAHGVDEPGIIDRWNRAEVPILVAHPASAGHGLNLQYGGHTIVWTSLTWSLEEWQQANKRLARQGQQHPVVIHMIVADRTVDTVIRQRLLDKADVQQSLLDHLESPL